MSDSLDSDLSGAIRWWGVAAAAIGLVVASTTFAGDFNGYGVAGPAYVLVLLFGFSVNLLVMSAYVELITMFPKAGQIFEFTKRGFSELDRRNALTIATGIGTTYWFVFGLVFAAEVSAGAHAMVSTTGVGTVTQWVVAMNLVAIVINVFGIRLTLLVETILILLMIGIRVAMGIAAFTGFNNLGHGGDFSVLLNFAPFGVASVLTVSTLGVWAFIGLEFATPLVEEVENPSRNMPGGILVGAFIILGMALIMGLGIITTYSPVTHQEVYTGNAPQIEIAGILFGPVGRISAGLASFIATMGSLLIAYAAIPRVLYAMARENAWPSFFSRVHPRFRSPWPAILATGAVFLLPVIVSNQVVPLIHAAAAVWLLIYTWVLVLAIKLKFTHPDIDRPFSRHEGFYVLGIVSIGFVFWTGFRDLYDLLGLGLMLFVIGFLFSKLWIDYFRAD